MSSIRSNNLILKYQGFTPWGLKHIMNDKFEFVAKISFAEIENKVIKLQIATFIYQIIKLMQLLPAKDNLINWRRLWRKEYRKLVLWLIWLRNLRKERIIILLADIMANAQHGCQVAVATATFHKCGFIKFQMAVKKILWLCGCKVAVNQIFRNFLIYLVSLNAVVWEMYTRFKFFDLYCS